MTTPANLFTAARDFEYHIGRDRCVSCETQLGPNKPAVFVVSAALGVIRVFCETCATFAKRGWKPGPPPG